MMKSFYLITALALICILAILQPASAAKYCNYCHEKIEQQWLTVDGKNYHPEHFKCTNCLGPISTPNFYVNDGKYYDSTCYANFVSKKCEYCGKPILGEAIYLDTKNYHKECYENHAGLRCVVCRSVVSLAFFVDSKGYAVCKEHKDIVLACFSCQRFMSPDVTIDGVEYDDGRSVCNDCVKTAINSVDDAEELINEVKWQLEFFGILIDDEFDLSFVSLNKLNNKFDTKMINHLGVTHFKKKEYLGGLFTSKVYDIRVLYGLPQSQLREVLAHELMHVWLFKNAPQPQEPQLCEGSCQYAAFLVLEYDTTSDGEFYLKQLLNQDDSVYGLGFQNVSKYIEKYGIENWLSYLKKNTESPW